MKLTPRDMLLCALLPALLTVAIYCCEGFRHTTMEIVSLKRQIRAYGVTETQLPAIEQMKAEKQRLEREIETARQSSASLEKLCGHLSSSNSSGARAQTLQKVSRLCELSGITLIGSSQPSGAKLPDVIQQTARTLCDWKRMPEPQLWLMELSGSYQAMVTFCESLSTADLLVMPISISMQPRTDETEPIRWMLTIWI